MLACPKTNSRKRMNKTKEREKKRKQKIEDKSKLIVFTLVALIVLFSSFLTLYNIQKIIKSEQEKEIFISPEGFSFKSDEEPEFELSLKEEGLAGITGMAVTDQADIKASVVDVEGKLTSIKPEIIKQEGKVKIKLPKQRSFRAGLYKLKIEYKDEIIEQNFTWGVLAINTHKSIYLENELANIGIAVLDNQGHMVCDADVILEITDPDGVKTILTTPNDIIVTEACYIYDITERPDYYTNYIVNSEGTYLINLTATTYDGTWNIQDNLKIIKV